MAPINKIINLGKISLVFIFLFAASCSRSAAPATRVPVETMIPAPASVTEVSPTEIATPEISITEISPTEIPPTSAPVDESSPTVPNNPVVIPPLSSAGAARIHETASLSFENPGRLIWSSDGNYLALMNGSGLVLLDGKTYETISNVEIAAPVVLLDFSPSSGKMATTSYLQPIEIRDISSGEVTQTIPFDMPFSSASFSRDGKMLAVCMANDIEVTVWDVGNGQQLKTLTGYSTAAPVYSGFFSPDGKYYIWQSRGTIQIMNIETGEFGTAIQHEDFISAAALSPDDTLLATAAGGTLNGYFQPLIKLWDPFSGEEKAALPAGDIPPTSLSLSQDGKLLASSDGNMLTLWNVETKQQIGDVSGHKDVISSVAISPDGMKIATASNDGTVRFWQIEPQ